MLKDQLHQAVRRFGFDVVRFDGQRFPQRKRAELMQKLGVDLVIDVGAHIGQYITEIRANGFDGRIVAFEPLEQPFEKLAEAAANDPRMTVHRFAIGAREGEGTINVSATSYSSSFLPMNEAHLRLDPDSGYVGEERVRIRTLDSFSLIGSGDAAWLKIDAQGYEKHVLQGAKQTLARVSAVEIELSYVTLYDTQSLAGELYATLDTHGFALAAFGRPLYAPDTSTLLQIDGIFLRT